MIRINEIKMSLDSSKEDLYASAAKILKLKNEQIKSITIMRQSVDSRKKDNVFYLFVHILFQNGCKVTAFFRTTKYNSKFFQFDYL